MQNRNTYLFLDPGNVAWHSCDKVINRIRPATKDVEHGVLLREDFFSEPARPWEVRYDNSYPNLIHDKEAGKYRLYYTLFLKDGGSADFPLEERPGRQYRPTSQRITGLCYAESNDGVNWTKPSLGLVEWNGSTDNNILLSRAHGAGVFLDEQETDPAKRFKLVAKLDFGNQNHFMTVCYSADGVHFSDPVPWPAHNPQADTHNVIFRDPRTGVFVLITRVWRNGLRIAVRSESNDFIHWTEPVEVLRGRGAAWQVYSMPVYYDAGLYIGLPSMYREGDRSSDDFDTVDVSLAFSPDLDRFDFAADVSPFIARGEGKYPTGEFDAGCVFAAAPVEVDGKLWFYYMGGNGQHTNFRETSLGRAWIERDKYAFFEPTGDEEGVLHTARYSIYGESVRALIEVEPGGSVRYEVVDWSTQEAVDGFSRDDCTPITADGWSDFRFERPFSSLPNSPFGFRILLSDARIFGLEGALWRKDKG